MATAIQICSYLLWLPLKLLGIHAIFKAGVSRYRLIFAYSLITFLLTVAQAPLSLAFHRTDQGRNWFEIVHYASQGLTYLLILAVVLDLIDRATVRLSARRLIRLALVLGGLLFVVISGFVHYDRADLFGAWVNRWTRDLNFCAAILDMLLWGMLIGDRRPDTRLLLLLTGGMGIMFTGEAIGAAVRDIGVRWQSYPVFVGGHIFVVLADAVFLYVWWQAFRNEAAREEAVRHAVSGTLRP